MRRFFWSLHILFFVFTVVVYALGYGLWSDHWFAGFLMMGIPILIAVHLVLAIFWFFVKRQRMWLSALAFLLSFPFWSRSFGFRIQSDTPPKADFSVMNYNVCNFDALNYWDQKDVASAPNMIQWVQHQNVDILCFQEFYNLSHHKTFNTTEQLQKQGYKYKIVMKSEQSPSEENFIGPAIFSKKPIINSQQEHFHDSNGLVYADIQIDSAHVVRVVNVHLSSLGIRFNKMKNAYKESNKNKLKSESKFILGRIKAAFELHAEQVPLLEKMITQSPYPIILCGDFNETAFGYTYGKMRNQLGNAFEENGSGFGFSYKNAPKYIRIDNQFFSEKTLQNTHFQTLSNVTYSDHFPLVGHYDFQKP